MADHRSRLPNNGRRMSGRQVGEDRRQIWPPDEGPPRTVLDGRKQVVGAAGESQQIVLRFDRGAARRSSASAHAGDSRTAQKS